MTKIIKNEKNNFIYYIDEEKRTVVCKRIDCEYEIMRMMSKNGLISIPSEISANKLILKSSYTGKAKCNPEDEWDEDVGMDIARRRMLKKYYSDKLIALHTYEEILNTLKDDVDFYIDRYEGKLDKYYAECDC